MAHLMLLWLTARGTGTNQWTSGERGIIGSNAVVMAHIAWQKYYSVSGERGINVLYYVFMAHSILANQVNPFNIESVHT
jgi:hypothetical protein